ncbi:hypothetical protein J7J84_05785 [bacterium]|nr:hypothetical protein [bacterium]
MKAAEVFLLTHSPAFQSFSYLVPKGLRFRVGDLVVVPFRKSLAVGVISELKPHPTSDGPTLKPLLGMARAPSSGPAGVSFGLHLLALARIWLCSPAEIFAHAVWGQVSRRASLFISRGTAKPPRELADDLEAMRLLLRRERTRFTPSLAKKLQRSVGFTDLLALIEHGALAVTATVGLEPAQQSPEFPAPRQQPLFATGEFSVKLDPDFALNQQAEQALTALARRHTGLEVPLAVRHMPWRELLSPTNIKRSLGNITGHELLLLPTQWHIDRLLAATPVRLRKRVCVFDPDAKAAEVRALASRLESPEPVLVVGKRASHFLLLHAPFAGVTILDPTADVYSSQQFPRYDTLIDCLLICALSGTSLTLVPLTPLPLELNRMTVNAEVIALGGAPGERIDQVVETIAGVAHGGSHTLVYNNAVGTGHEVFCEWCHERVVCPQCGRALTYLPESRELACSRCGHIESAAECPACGSRQLGVTIIGVEGLARRVRKQLRKLGRHPAPRVGYLTSNRKESIRVPNLSRTDVLIGTSTLLTPLHFYHPKALIYVAQDIWPKGDGDTPELSVVAELSRLAHLYEGRIERTIVLAPRTLAEAVRALLGARGGQARAELDALRRQYHLPPFNVQVDFTLYGSRQKAVGDFAEEMKGQLEFASGVLNWDSSRVLKRGRETGYMLRGSVLLKRFSARAFADLRRRGKGKRLDLVFSPRYY